MKFKHKKNGKTFELAPIKGKYHLVVAFDTLEEMEAFRKANRKAVFGARMTPEGTRKTNIVPFRRVTEV